jgi:hypothetical protein
LAALAQAGVESKQFDWNATMPYQVIKNCGLALTPVTAVVLKVLKLALSAF